MVVDDEEDIVVYISAIFEDNGYETISAEDGDQALKLAKTEKPDLITLDITMPEQSGIRVYRQYRTDPELKEIPVIIITATGESMDNFAEDIKGFQSPESFINKPVDQEELLARAKDLLSK